jgi:hypothetical protein
MADPFAIIGLTASIISFIDFSLKIFTAAKNLSASSLDTTEELHELGCIIKDIRRNNQELLNPQKARTRKLRHDEVEAIRLAELSDELAKKIEKKLRSLKKRPGTPKIIDAWRIQWHQQLQGKEIQSLRQRLFDLDGRVRVNVRRSLQG